VVSTRIGQVGFGDVGNSQGATKSMSQGRWKAS
jgi:hypothetical protein